jgi:hypothetical protein
MLIMIDRGSDQGNILSKVKFIEVIFGVIA